MDLLRYNVIIIMYCYESSAASDFLKEQLSSISGTNDGVVEVVCAGTVLLLMPSALPVARTYQTPPHSLSLRYTEGITVSDRPDRVLLSVCLSVLWSHLLKLRVTNEHKADGYHFTPMLR